MPTTIWGMIDAAIGGKTGVNLPEGKNLVGAFWQPTAVLCDTDALRTLPPREHRSGMGELAKYHFLDPDAQDLDALPLDEQIAACVRIKAAVVASDEHEGDRRAILNYGHTLGHALETIGSYDLRHGEAVASVSCSPRNSRTCSAASTQRASASIGAWWVRTTCLPHCPVASIAINSSRSLPATRRRSTA